MKLFVFVYFGLGETQDAKGRETLTWILPHHTYVAKVNLNTCKPRLLHLIKRARLGVELESLTW